MMKTAKSLFDFIQAEKEHRLIFRRATPRSQILKLNEKWEEYQNAKSTEEGCCKYGDFLFIIISLRRFKETQIIADALLDKYYFSRPLDEKRLCMKYLQKAVEKSKIKMVKREYFYKKGNKGENLIN